MHVQLYCVIVIQYAYQANSGPQKYIVSSKSCTVLPDVMSFRECLISATPRTDNRKMTVNRTFFTVRHEIHRLLLLHSLVNQDMRTESCIAGHRVEVVIIV